LVLVVLEEDLSPGDFRDASGVNEVVGFVELGGICFGIFDDGPSVGVTAGDGHGEDEVFEEMVSHLVLARGEGPGGGMSSLSEEGFGDFVSGWLGNRDGFGTRVW